MRLPAHHPRSPPSFPRSNARAWGANGFGQLGNGEIGDSAQDVVIVSGSLQFTSVVVGGYHVCGLEGGGAAYCWGKNMDGLVPILGVGEEFNGVVPQPSPVLGGHTFAALAAGVDFTLGLLANGSLLAWVRRCRRRRRCCCCLANVVVVVVVVVVRGRGQRHTRAPRPCQRLPAASECGPPWLPPGPAPVQGSNNYGQLGVGDTDPRSVPTPVATDATFTGASAGNGFACAMRADTRTPMCARLRRRRPLHAPYPLPPPRMPHSSTLLPARIAGAGAAATAARLATAPPSTAWSPPASTSPMCAPATRHSSR